MASSPLRAGDVIMLRLVTGVGRAVVLLSAILLLGGIGPPPAPASDPASPLRAKLLGAETKPLPGMTAINALTGPIYPEGARARLLLQAATPQQVIEIDHIYVKVKKLPTPAGQQLAYNVDPLKQPGFGFAAPRKFNLIVGGETNVSINYTDERLDAHSAIFPDMLPQDLPIIRLDVQSGIQETLDLNIKLVNPGLYQIDFEIRSVSNDVAYMQTTGSLQLFKQ
jgi:hypothetical protein